MNSGDYLLIPSHLKHREGQVSRDATLVGDATPMITAECRTFDNDETGKFCDNGLRGRKQRIRDPLAFQECVESKNSPVGLYPISPRDIPTYSHGMKTLLIAGMLCTGFFLTGCVVPVAVDQRHGQRYHDSYRTGYPEGIGFTPLIVVRP